MTELGLDTFEYEYEYDGDKIYEFRDFLYWSSGGVNIIFQ